MCVCDAGLAGQQQDTLGLHEEHLLLSEKNKLDSSSMKMPYAQLVRRDDSRSHPSAKPVSHGWARDDATRQARWALIDS